MLTLSRGFYSADEPVLHFGLGEEEKIARLTVEWPSGIVQEFQDLDADRFYTITESRKSSGQPFREFRRAAAAGQQGRLGRGQESPSFPCRQLPRAPRLRSRGSFTHRTIAPVTP